MNKYEKIGRLLYELKKAGEYIEIIHDHLAADGPCDQLASYGPWSLSGYSGFDGVRYSNIEDHPSAQELISLLNEDV